MSFTHTLSIQGVHATLQMNVEHSVVKYTLTLRADSGEESVANGRLPNDAMDNYMVIDQYVTNPEPKEQDVQTMESNILREAAVLTSTSENNLDHSYSSTTMFFDIEDTTDSFTECFSPIAPSSPTYVDDSRFEQELQDLSNKVCVNVEEPLEQVEQAIPVENPVEIPVPSFNQMAMIDQLEMLRQYTNLNIKQGIIQAVHQHLVENNITIGDYPLLQEFMTKLFYELLVVHVNDIILRDECITMLRFVGAEVDEYVKRITSEYNLLCKVGKHYKLNVSEESLLSYWNWKPSYNGPSFNRWNLMKTYLYQRK